MGKTPAGIMIRTLTAADLTAVSSIDEKSFFDVWSPSMWLDELNNSLTTYLVLEDAGRILGYAGFWRGGRGSADNQSRGCC